MPAFLLKGKTCTLTNNLFARRSILAGGGRCPPPQGQIVRSAVPSQKA